MTERTPLNENDLANEIYRATRSGTLLVRSPRAIRARDYPASSDTYAALRAYEMTLDQLIAARIATNVPTSPITPANWMDPHPLTNTIAQAIAAAANQERFR